MSEYLGLNQAMWDERAAAHAGSPGYAMQQFVDDPEFLSDVVRFDLPRLGDIAGLRGVHLQCHIGTDTVSLARLGAVMTGLDFSGEAVSQARAFAARVGADVEFVQADLYDALSVLPEHAFDLVFTGIGALCWLPDIARWAEIVARLLAPGGQLFLRDGHPMLGTVADPDESQRLIVEYPYFERAEAMVWDKPNTYVETEHEFENTRSAQWNHGLGEIVTALLAHDLRITALTEHDSAPWTPLVGMMEPLDNGEFRLADRPWRLPLTFTLQAVAPDRDVAALG